MKKIYKLAIALSTLLLLFGCGSSSPEVQTYSNDSEMFTEHDLTYTYDEDSSTVIELNNSTASCNSDAVQISENTIIIKDEGTFIISGTLEDGMIIINANENDKPHLVFDGVSINSDTSAPIYVAAADKVFITLADGSKNTLSNGGTYEPIDENNIDSVIYSKEDLTINGSGILTVTSPSGHGIVSKDDLVLSGGTYTINSSCHGLDANDSIRISSSEIKIDAGKDGIHAENTDDEQLGFIYIKDISATVDSEGDGISASSYLQVESGTFNITSGGGSENASVQSSSSYGGFMGNPPGKDNMHHSNKSNDSDTSEESTSMKGIKSSGSLVINEGNFTIDSADDALHSNSSISVTDGTFNISTGDDGLHADETLVIKNGKIDIMQSYEGLEALDISIEGGNINLIASDDGLNAAGGTDSSGFGGERGNDQFGGPGGQGGPESSSSNGSIIISGGNLFINASGDGIDANGFIEISGGFTTVIGPTQGDTATLDYDTTASITGGTFIGTGAYGMAQTFSDSSQGVIAVSVGNIAAGTAVTLSDSQGNIIEYTPELNYAVVILSSPEIIKGNTYTLTAGEISGEVTAS